MPRLRRDRVTWLVYVLLGMWGYVNYGFGPVVPLLRDEQAVSASVASLHGTALAVGAMLGGTLFPWVAGRLGRGNALWVGIGAVAVTVLGFFLAHSLPATLLATVAMGAAGATVVNAVVGMLTAYHGPAGPAAIAEANALACAMGVVAPVVVGFTVGAGLGWRPGLAVVVGLIGLLAVLAFTTGVRLPYRAPTPTLSTVESPPGRLPGSYWLAWTLMSVTGSVEVCLSLWAAEVLRGHAGMDPAGAAAAVSSIVAGMFVGRLAGGRLALRIAPVPLFLGALAASGVGFALFWAAEVPWLAVTGLVVLGLGNAMHYPLGISLALRTAPGLEDRAAARASYSLAVSFGIAPFLLGAVADGFGAHRAFLLVPVLFVAAAVLVTRLGRRMPVLPGATAPATAAA